MGNRPFGYLLGSFPTGVVLSRMRFGIDVREMGSGNIGATNITRNFGWLAGAFALLMDFLKAWAPLKLMQDYLPGVEWVICATGVAVVLGHCFSIFLGFRGGRGSLVAWVAWHRSCLLRRLFQHSLTC
jgi:glycerol-3-phosphate acyltransferase PlsY